MEKTVILGAEHDEPLRGALLATLRAMGGVVEDKDWALAGSQEIAACSVRLGGGTLTVEAETYVGLSLSGEAALVDRVVARLPDFTPPSRSVPPAASPSG